jgi:Flp pilus assembly pilin Flp
MNKIKKIQTFLVDEAGGETVEWAVVVSALITIAVTVYSGGLQAAIQSAMDSIASTISSL